MDHIEYRKLDDLTWCLVEKSIEEVLADYQSNDSNNYDNPLVIINYKQESLQQVDIFSNNKVSALELIAKVECDDVDITFEVSIKNQQYKNHLNIKANSNILENYLSDIFSKLLITGRPLRYYNCTFFLPLDLMLDSEIAMHSNNTSVELIDNEDVKSYKITPPVSLLKKEGRPTDDDIAHAQAYEYFYSHIQDQLFETTEYKQQASHNALKPIVHHRLQTTKNLTLRLNDKKKNGSGEITTAQVEDISLYEYYNGMLLLGIRVGLPQNILSKKITSFCWVNEEDENYKEKKQQQKNLENENSHLFNLICNEKNWWKSLVFSDISTWREIQTLQVENWLRYSKLVRILYVNFFEQLNEFKIAPIELYDGKKKLISSKVKDEFNAVILHILKWFIKDKHNELNRYGDIFKKDNRLKQVTDERMFVHASYVLVGAPPKANTHEAEEFERLFSYALYVDQHTDGYDNAQRWTYDKDFLQQKLKQQSITRWKSISSLSGYTDYSTVFMGFTAWFQNPTATVHVPYVYAKMQIQILLYSLTLQHLDRCTAVATRRLKESKGKSEDFSDLRLSLIEFTNEYWFRELTPQLQGKEITKLMIEQQGLNEKYELIKDKLDRANDYTTTVKDFLLQGKAVFVGWVASLFAVLTFVPPIINALLDNNPETTAIGSWITVGIVSIGASAYYLWNKRQSKKLGRTK